MDKPQEMSEQMNLDIELSSLEKIIDAMNQLDQEARVRVVVYIVSRFKMNPQSILDKISA